MYNSGDAAEQVVRISLEGTEVALKLTGSAAKNIAAMLYRAAAPEENKIFTQNVRMGLDGRKHRRNLNTVVVGGSGAGKTRFYAKPSAPVRAV